ncbi:MAG: PEP-CTERM sorting domain-containing protein [Planctomycetota bacterium]|jgi:hypothetical protein
MRALTAAAVACALLLAATPAMADQVLGVNSSKAYPSGGLYLIDTETGGSWRIGPTHYSLAHGHRFGPNGLAIGERGVVYYTSYGEPGGDSLFSYNVASGVTKKFSTPLAGPVASGSFYKSQYYYIEQFTSDLHAVTFNPDGSITDNLILSGDAAWSFGDIAITDKGILYGSAGDDGRAEFFSIDLADGTYNLIRRHEDKYQLAFADGTLYGLVTDTGRMYRIDVTNGALDNTGLGRVGGGRYMTDLAGPASSLPVPEPAALGLLVLGLGTVLFRRRARRRA